MMRQSHENWLKTQVIATLVFLTSLFVGLLPLTLKPQSVPTGAKLMPGQSVTHLPDGGLLLVGGQGAGGGLNTILVWDAQTRRTIETPIKLQSGRSWHSATLLPDGTVLVLGGIGIKGQMLGEPEIIDLESQKSSMIPSTNLTPRARHTATLLTDGHVFISGGVGSGGEALRNAQWWDLINQAVVTLSASISQRRDHTSTLLPDGRVLLWGGSDNAGNALNNGEIFDPSTQQFTTVQSFPSMLLPQSADGPALVASIPIDRTVDVDPESMISLRFSKPLRVETVNDQTVSLSGPNGIEKITVVPAENGSLAFINPESLLLPGITYAVSVSGAIDRNGLILPVSGLSFSTKPIPGGISTPRRIHPPALD